MLWALLELVLIIANVGTAVVPYVVYKRYSQGLALGYVAARLVEAMFIAIGIISLLTFVFMRQEGTARTQAAKSGERRRVACGQRNERRPRWARPSSASSSTSSAPLAAACSRFRSAARRERSVARRQMRSEPRWHADTGTVQSSWTWQRQWRDAMRQGWPGWQAHAAASHTGVARLEIREVLTADMVHHPDDSAHHSQHHQGACSQHGGVAVWL